MTSKSYTISGVPKEGFCRCGTFFPNAGIPVNAEDFDADQWRRLKAEPNLRVALAEADPASDAAARDAQIREAIKSLSPEDFQKDGKPKIDALFDLLGDDLGKITTAERNAAWDALTSGGFGIPAATAPA
ncbi:MULTISPECIES: HI1506-related protein [Phaeobacter]|uniref:HI1506-related protein n=1 Tax=Phaeobacter TaxID=302485 RepID=UPI000591131C|nr:MULTISPECIES: HI1506-related protein [Phaeobacter]KII14112.1 hypothetical protein OO25_13875 [Phaeobacter sp. S60]UTS80926.1 hypothetical protein OL67_001997 [Phaeobacter piscinae]